MTQFETIYGKGNIPIFAHGKTPLEAAMRCDVASKFGEEVESGK